MTRLTFDELEAFARDLGRPDDAETMYRAPHTLHPYPPAQPANEPATPDAVNPDHYKVGGIEAIDYMRAKSSRAEFTGYLRLSALKYLSRAGHKGEALEDYRKAQWFINRLVEELEH